MLWAIVTPFDSCIFFDWLLQRFEVQTAVTDSKLEPEALEEVIGAQALSADLRVAVMACLSGGESRRWTLSELVGRLKNLGICATKALVTAAPSRI